MKKRILAVSMAFLILFLTACSSAPEVEYGPDVENPYPEVKGPLMATVMDMTPQEIVSNGSSYVKGVVKAVNPPVEKAAEAEWFDVLLEKNPDAVLPNITYYSISFAVENVLAGANVPSEITLYTIFPSCLPENIAVGDSMIIAVYPTDAKEIYGLGHITLAFYYISEENRVYPAGRMDSTVKYTGMTVDMFKDVLNKQE